MQTFSFEMQKAKIQLSCVCNCSTLISKFNLKVKFNLQLLGREGMDYTCNSSNIALISEIKCFLQGVVILSFSFFCIKNKKQYCPRVSNYRDFSHIRGLHLTHVDVAGFT